jgi:LPXTG-motif cell wall-anchored protein
VPGVITPARRRSRIGRALALLAVTGCLVAPGTALAGQQSLPDPNGGDKQEKAKSMPRTGTSVALLIAGGVTLLAGGLAVRPMRRRRRSYRSDVWLEAVRGGSTPGSG